jgi:hypothetical protein
VYEGHFKDGVAHGHGLQKQGHFMASVASVYIGEWANGVKQGYGVMDDIVTGMFVLKGSIIAHVCPIPVLLFFLIDVVSRLFSKSGCKKITVEPC